MCVLGVGTENDEILLLLSYKFLFSADQPVNFLCEKNNFIIASNKNLNKYVDMPFYFKLL